MKRVCMVCAGAFTDSAAGMCKPGATTSGRVRPLDLTPAPLGHRREWIGCGARLRVDDCQARTPFEITDQRRAKFRIVRHLQFVCGVEQERNPFTSMGLSKMAVQMVLNHGGMPAMLGGIVGGPAQ